MAVRLRGAEEKRGEKEKEKKRKRVARRERKSQGIEKEEIQGETDEGDGLQTKRCEKVN